MINCFNVTSIGHSHIKEGKVCQDFSLSYSDGNVTVVTACDGHGGDIYIRSDRGSRFASYAFLETMISTAPEIFRKFDRDDIEKNIKLNILCSWNSFVGKDLLEHPTVRKREIANLSEGKITSLKNNPVKAYGTTLGGAMLWGNKLVCAGIGDGGMFLMKNGEIAPALPDDDDEPVANVTYSLCSEDAFEHLKVKVYDMRQLDGVILCTDGILGAYQTEENFKTSFVHPVVRKTLDGKVNEVKEFIRELGERSGIGDDVSLSLILKSNIKVKYYQ